MRGGNDCPIKPQVWIHMNNLDCRSNSMQSSFQIRRICENDCIGFDVTNTGRDILVIEKASQAVAYLSVWATVRMEDDGRGGRF